MKSMSCEMFVKRPTLLAIVAASLQAHAGVVVLQNVSPGATSWPGTPIISTMVNPSSANVLQTFTNGTAGNTNIAQTFTLPTTNYVLQSIDIYAGGGTGTGTGTNITLNLYDLGYQTAPNPAPYRRQAYKDILGANLFGSGTGLTISYTNQANGILEFDFTGADQALLRVGHMYVFELIGMAGTGPLNWYCVTSGNPYTGGAAYARTNYWLNGVANSSADFSMAIYANVSANPPAEPPHLNGVCTVNWGDVRQRIDGFGASSAFAGSGFTTAQYDMLFSTNAGIGLSLLRNQVQAGGFASAGEISIMQQAQNRGARVWSAPWSPQSSFKVPPTANGGNYAGGLATNQAYANQLASYVATMKNQGINLYALSIQNEPNITNASYATCWWSSQQISNFVPFLYNALVASNVSATKIMLPESFQWQNSINLYTTAMNDPNIAAMVGIIADHNYDGVEPDPATGTPAAIASYGKALWETEVAILDPSGSSDSSIQNGIYWAGRIHAFMTVAQVNAWHHWWLIYGNSTPNQGLTDISKTTLAKRGYVLGQYSRFVRPNYYRLGVITNQGAVMVSAYKDTNSSSFAVVAINGNAINSIDQTFNLTNFTAATVTPWITSGTLSLSNQAAVAVMNSSFTYTLPAISVVTFVGQADLAPTNILLSNSSVMENQPAGALVGNFSTLDPDAGNTFTYSLAGGAGGADNGKFAITNTTLYTAGFLDAAVQNTQSIRVRTTDQRGLWFEKNFNVTITPDVQARRILNISAAPDGNRTLTFAGIPGYAYRVQAATGLTPPIAWATLTNNFDGSILFTADTSGLWMHADLNSTNCPSRFYRTVEP